MINQQILKLYLHLLAYHCNITFLDPGFFPALRDQGCSAVKSWFALQNRRRSPRSDSRPHLTGESVIAIPCFVHDCHWVAVTRREVAGRILFLYADDLNSPTTEASVRQMFSMCGKDFFPDSAVWVTCKNYTYSPHSNECGARTLPALKIQALHPNPHSTILIPSMHQYIAQISRTWVAMTLTQNQFLYTLLDKVMSHSPIEEMNLHGPWTLPTAPATLIGWTALSSESSAPEIPCTDSSTKFPQGGTLTIPKSSANPPPNSPQTDHHYLRASIVASNRHSPICMSTAQPLNPCAPSFVPMETCESPVTGRPTKNQDLHPKDNKRFRQNLSRQGDHFPLFPNNPLSTSSSPVNTRHLHYHTTMLRTHGAIQWRKLSPPQSSEPMALELFQSLRQN